MRLALTWRVTGGMVRDMNRLHSSIAVAVACLLSVDSHALTTPQSGLWVQGLGGLSVSRVGAAPGWQVGAGWWWGNYDREYALGRYWGLGVAAHQEWSQGGLRTSPQLELRRGNDVIVVGTHWFLSAGPSIAEADLGVEARAGFGGRFRFNPSVSGLVRLEARGGLQDNDWHAGGALVVGVQWARPLRQTD